MSRSYAIKPFCIPIPYELESLMSNMLKYSTKIAGLSALTTILSVPE